MITLYSYFRSSTSYRVRIALNLKGLDYKTIPINILSGEQHGDDYLSINAAAGVPAIIHNDFTLTQSLAIIEYLDAVQPAPRLICGSAAEQAYIRQLSMTIATDIHPLTNLRVLNTLRDDLALDDAGRAAWYARWAESGLAAFESHLRTRGWYGRYALGDDVSMADACLIPQMYNMRRFDLPLHDYPICRQIEAHCMALPDFQNAAPEMQPDAPRDLIPIHGPKFKTA